jgi:hypothetical protein
MKRALRGTLVLSFYCILSAEKNQNFSCNQSKTAKTFSKPQFFDELVTIDVAKRIILASVKKLH